MLAKRYYPIPENCLFTDSVKIKIIKSSDGKRCLFLEPAQRNTGSSALSGKILLVRIVENNKIDAYFRTE